MTVIPDDRVAIDAVWCDPYERAGLARSIAADLDRMLGLTPADGHAPTPLALHPPETEQQ